jgi:hypothetical protein
MVADDHKAYYPGARKIHLRITGDATTGQLLGAQFVRHLHSWVHKRVDVFAAALFHALAVDEVEDLDLSPTRPRWAAPSTPYRRPPKPGRGIGARPHPVRPERAASNLPRREGNGQGAAVHNRPWPNTVGGTRYRSSEPQQARGSTMALDFDSRKNPRNHADFKRLVHAIRHASKADETIWLEWKSDLELDPADKGDKSGRAHVARAIIGFANRMPDDAGRFAQGHGILMVGVGPEGMPGVRPHDITELVRWITPYVGNEIGWMPTYVEAEGENGPVAVLIVTVDPPEWGDPIHCMRKEAPSKTRDKSIPEAAIFVRTNEGVTRPARARDIDALTRRIQHRQPTMELAVEVIGGSIQPLSCTDEDIDSWLDAEREAALESLNEFLARRPGRSTDRHLFASLHAYALTTIPEERSVEQYRHQVEQHLLKCRTQLAAAVHEAAAARVLPVTLRVLNQTDVNLENVQVELYVPGEVQALEVGSDRLASNEHFPRALPALPHYGSVARALPIAFSPGLPAARTFTPSQTIHIVNGGSATIHLPPVHLRPRRHADLEAFVLVAAVGETGPTTAEWSATCTNQDGVVTGQVEIPRAEPMLFYETFVADEEEE